MGLGLGIGVRIGSGASRGRPYPTAGLQVIVYNTTYEEEGTTYLRTSTDVGIPKVSGSGLDTIWDFSVLNDARFDKSNATYWGATLDAYFYYDAGNPYHGKLKDFKYYELNNQVLSKNQIFAKSSYNGDGYIDTDRILVYSEELITSNLSKVLVYCNELYEIKLSALDGLSVINERGNNAALKELSVLDLDSTAYLQTSNNFKISTNSTVKYEYVFILDAIGDKKVLLNSQYYGMNILRSRTGGGWQVYFKNSTGDTEIIDGVTDYWLEVGLNVISIELNTLTLEYTIIVNNNIKSGTLTISGSFDDSLGYFRIGFPDSPQKPISFSFTKNSVIENSYIFSNQTFKDRISDAKNHSFYDLVGINHLTLNPITINATFSEHSLINPYENGYDLYWNIDTIDELKVTPKNSNGDSLNLDNLDLFASVEANDIGYHVINYIEMPDYDIFDTTNRDYWKASIELDPYYVGDELGKERYFHKTWLNSEWIEVNIEDDYKKLFIVNVEYRNAEGQKNVPIKLKNIILYNVEKDDQSVYNSLALGNLFFSKQIEYNASSILYPTQLLASKDDIRVSVRKDLIQYSSDRGKTWSGSVTLADINVNHEMPISLVRILNNNRILIFSKEKELYYSDDNLATIIPCTVLDKNGDPYGFHTPVNSDYPGGYFHNFHNFVEDGNLLIYGNYANADSLGAAPVNLYYSLDGITWKVFYTFGQNPLFTDDGTSRGGTTGNILGDALNPILCRHVHGINKGYDGNYYVCTGDNNVTKEMHFLKVIYDSVEDNFTITDLLNNGDASSWQRMRAIGIIENNGYIYWGSDGTFDTIVNDITRHELLQELNDEAYAFLRLQDNSVICGLDNPKTYCYISNDKGDTWTKYNINNDEGAMRPADFDETNKYLILQNHILQYLK